MRAMIIGCGKLGCAVALELFKRGHDVTVVDSDPNAFYRLGSEFSGNTVVGVAYDKDTLEEAGIQFMDAVILATGSDDMNATTGRVCKDFYMVPRTIARINDPRRAKIYESLGIKTISPTGFGADRAIELLSFDRMDSISMLGENGDTEIIRIITPQELTGATVEELTAQQSFNLFAIVRGHTSFLPLKDEKIQTGDILYFAVKTADKPRLKRTLGL